MGLAKCFYYIIFNGIQQYENAHGRGERGISIYDFTQGHGA